MKKECLSVADQARYLGELTSHAAMDIKRSASAGTKGKLALSKSTDSTMSMDCDSSNLTLILTCDTPFCGDPLYPINCDCNATFNGDPDIAGPGVYLYCIDGFLDLSAHSIDV